MIKNIINSLEEIGYSSKESKILIMAKKVKVNNEIVSLTTLKINQNDVINVEKPKKFVSRGAYKLLEAIEKFNLNFKDKVILDIGSSTGGFTQVSLMNGASHVYALDSGTNQLDFSLRKHEKVTSIERTNLKNIVESMFEKQIDFVVCDVSFISLKYIFEVISKFSKNIPIMALIKPQFEATRNQVLKGGVVPIELHDEILKRVFEYGKKNGYKLKKIEKSPITGNVSKNIEYISLFERAQKND